MQPKVGEKVRRCDNEHVQATKANSSDHSKGSLPAPTMITCGIFFSTAGTAAGSSVVGDSMKSWILLESFDDRIKGQLHT